MTFRREHLFKTLIYGSGMRVLALGSQLVVLVMLGRLLDPQDFGNFMIAFAFFRLGALFVGTGTGTLLSYYVARAPRAKEIDLPLHRTLGGVTLLCSFALSALIVVPADWLAELFGKPELAFWLMALWPILPFSALLSLAVGGMEGRGEVRSAIFLNEFAPNVIRLIGLAVLIWFSGGVELVPMIFWVSLALPWLLVLRALLRGPKGFGRLSLWDGKFAGLYGLNSLAAQQLQGIDLIVVGYFFTSEQAASYAIASRIASLYPYLQTVAVRQSISAIGAQKAAGDISGLNLTLKQLREVSRSLVGVVLLVCALGWSLIEIAFKGYDLDRVIVVALAAPIVMRTSFAGLDVVLRMSGRAEYNLMITMLAALSMILGAVLFSGQIGLGSLAFGMLAGSIVLNVWSSLLLRREQIRSTDRTSFGLGLSLALVAMGLAYAPWPMLVLGFLGLVLVLGSFGRLRLKG